MADGQACYFRTWARNCLGGGAQKVGFGHPLKVGQKHTKKNCILDLFSGDAQNILF